METKDWYAWLNLMLPKPDDFHIIGKVYVENPGIIPWLTPHQPQGFNPKILMLDLNLFQKPGNWIDKMTWVETRYDKVLFQGILEYDQIHIFYEGASLATFSVEEVS